MKTGKTVEEVNTIKAGFIKAAKATLKPAAFFATKIVETFAELRDGDENDERETVKEIKATLIEWAVEAGMTLKHAAYNVNTALRNAGISQRAPRSDKGSFPNEAKELAAYAIKTYGEDRAAAFCNSAGRYIKTLAKVA